ncbi:cyclophilin type peptidyl-prolyl cis-trans isomerase [Catenovulum agarivorans DS-2]|uniref:peptidylprolyl isomerase n=1 Tax=Catenovulum agarivorans DS-2 TaxID=1328313 RepID=W7QN86_9ALTE|nr:peptidylprolyl isomerase [Catenovulum agarivorans]EWH10412.1 cyclophilin type peptidyl-prolyl cis-trans isomerase [Catenovulum agarivorans DS-2]
MNYKSIVNFAKISLLSASILSTSAFATIVKIKTNQGDITVNLFDQTTPKTVENFLQYVNDDSYDNSVFHRSVKDFIVQAGSYSWSMQGEQTKPQFNSIESGEVVENEPLWSNVKGTIAMAKTGQEHSATSGWFINLNDDNVENLDLQASGFTVFGQVTEGMDIVEKINALEIYNAGSPFDTIPLDNVPDDANSIETEYLVIISDIEVLDSAEDTADDLQPVANTLIYQENIDTIEDGIAAIETLIETSENNLALAKTAQTAAAAISDEKGETASAAVVKIEVALSALDTLQTKAEDILTDAKNGQTNGESVLTIIDYRNQMVDTYQEVLSEATTISSQLSIAESAAKKESSGGSFSFGFILAALGLLGFRKKFN